MPRSSDTGAVCDGGLYDVLPWIINSITKSRVVLALRNHSPSFSIERRKRKSKDLTPQYCVYPNEKYPRSAAFVKDLASSWLRNSRSGTLLPTLALSELKHGQR